MQFVVAFDGTPVSKTALGRAATLATAVDGDVTAVTVIPGGNGQYARERGWLDEGESFARESVLETLRTSIESVAPTASLFYRAVDRYAPRGKIGRVLRSTAEEEGVDVFTIGTGRTPAGYLPPSRRLHGASPLDRTISSSCGNQTPRFGEFETTPPRR